VRIFLAALIWLLFIGGLSLFMHHRDQAMVSSEAPAVIQKIEKGNFALLITPTFAVEPDPFAILAADDEKPPALLVRIGDREILRKTDQIPAGAPIRLEPLTGLVFGDNEMYLEVSPPVEQADRSHAVRVQIFQDDLPLAEKTFWSPAGGKVADTFRFALRAPDEKEDNHDAH
jgi:hypothetical protein